MNYEYKYYKYKTKYLNFKKKQSGGGFLDDVSPLLSYAIYGHGELITTTEKTFVLNENQNIIYLDEPGKPYPSLKAIELWNWLSHLNDHICTDRRNTYDWITYIKLISGYIDTDVTEFISGDEYLFNNIRFYWGGDTVNNLKIAFTPLPYTDIQSDIKIGDNTEVIKSGVYSIPIGFNYPEKYCQNLDDKGSMLFRNYKSKPDKADIDDIDDMNVFSKHSNDTYYCGLPANIGDEGEYNLNTKDECNTIRGCNINHNRLIDNKLKPSRFNHHDGVFMSGEYRYKEKNLNTILNNFMKVGDDNVSGTFILPVCRSSIPSEETTRALVRSGEHLEQRENDINKTTRFIKKIIWNLSTMIKNIYDSSDEPKKEIIIRSVYKEIIEKIVRADIDRFKASGLNFLNSTSDNTRTTLLKNFNNLWSSKKWLEKDDNDSNVWKQIDPPPQFWNHIVEIICNYIKIIKDKK